MSESNPQVMNDTIWQEYIRLARTGVPRNYTTQLYRNLMFDLQATIIARLKQTPQHGSTLPSNPQLNDVFLLVNNNQYSLALCETVGTWTTIKLGGSDDNEEDEISTWVSGYELAGIADTLTPGQFKHLTSNNLRWAVKLKSGDKFNLKIGDEIKFYSKELNATLTGKIIDHTTNVLSGSDLVFNFASVSLGTRWSAAGSTGWAIAKVADTPIPSLSTPKAPTDTGSAGDDFSEFPSKNHAHPKQQIQIPNDQIGWRGSYANNTDYEQGEIVTFDSGIYLVTTDVPATNTTAPDTNPAFTRIALGSPDDITGLSLNGQVLTVTKRDDSTETITLPEAFTQAYKDKVNSALQKSDFEPSETARYAFYGNDFSAWSGSGNSQLISFFTGEPASGTLIKFPDLTAKDVTGVTKIWITQDLLTTNDQFSTETATEPQPLSGAVFKLHPYDSNDTITFTLSEDAESSVSGRARWMMTGTMTQTADWNPGGAGFVAIDETEPTQFRIPEAAVEVNNSFFNRLRSLNSWTSSIGGTMANFYVSTASSRLTYLTALFTMIDGFWTNSNSAWRNARAKLMTRLRSTLMTDASSATDPLGDAAELVMLFNSLMSKITIEHLRKHVLPGLNEFTGYVTGNGDEKGEISLTGSGNQITLVYNDDDETDMQLDIKPNTLIALQRVSNTNEFHLGLVSSRVKQTLGTVDVFTITFVANEFRTVGSFDFNDVNNYGEAVKIVTFGDKIRWQDLVQVIRNAVDASYIKIPSERAVRLAIDEGDDLAHEHIELLADLLDEFYEGWTGTGGQAAHYTASQTQLIQDNLVDAINNDPNTTPAVGTEIILRSGTAWGGPPGMVWGFDFLSGNSRYVLGITTGGAADQIWKREGVDWVLIWDDDRSTPFTSGYENDQVFGTHWFDVVDGDIKLFDPTGGRHQWTIPGFTGGNFAIYRRGKTDATRRDVVAFFPNYGGENIINYSWNRFAVEAQYVKVDASGFDRRLATTDDDVQKVAQKLDDLATVASTGSYNDLSDPPMIPPVLPVYPLVGTATDVTETYGDLATGLNDDDFLLVTTECYYGSESSNIELNMTQIRFGNLSTSDRWIPIRAASGGARFMIKRVTTGQKIQTRRAGSVSSTNTVRCYKVGTATE